jgi:hypothetical protein
MERQFFLSLIELINEVQGKQKLPSQVGNRKSAWCKTIKSQRIKKDALSQV